MRLILLWSLLFYNLCMVGADLKQELASLSVGLSMLEYQLKPKLKVETGTSTTPLGQFEYRVYTLENGKKIRVEVAEVSEINTFDTKTRTFTELRFDAITNAANEACTGGGGLDGAVHTAIDKKLVAIDKKPGYTFQDVCENLPIISGKNRCKTGDAKLVPGLTLAPFIVQAVGPTGGDPNRENLLRGAYENSLNVVSQDDNEIKKIFKLKNNTKNVSNEDIYAAYKISLPEPPIKSIAFPPISTAIFGYAVEKATPIAIDTVVNFLKTKKTPLQEVMFYIWVPGNVGKTQYTYRLYIEELNKKLGI